MFTMHALARMLPTRLPGLSPGSRLDGTEVVLTGSFDILDRYLAWERQNLVIALEVAPSRVRAVRAWLSRRAAGRWSCTMPEGGMDAAWSVPPGPQVFRLSHAGDAEALRKAFPEARRVASA